MLNGEEKLIKDAISGEASAFGSLYDYYQPKIYRFIYLKVSHREEAEDLTHQVFLNAWQNISKYEIKGPSFFSGWLYQIARNQVIDHYRTRKPAVDIEIIADLMGTNSGLAENFDAGLEMEKVRKAVLKLKDEQQDVIIMRFIEEMTPEEIAVALDKPASTIRVLQHRAIKNLKNLLETN